jgi:hypothetical protein
MPAEVPDRERTNQASFVANLVGSVVVSLVLGFLAQVALDLWRSSW